MSDLQNTSAATPQAQPAQSEGPVLTSAVQKPAPAARSVEPIGDHDTSILSHLGMPFYYRHAPTRAAARGTVWVTFLILVAIVVLNVIQMPYDKDTYIYAIRATFFSPYPAYTTAEEGAAAIFYQLFCISIVLSGIVAPLFGTYSFSSERVLGTLEFLRLSPMSSLSVVMGKMFAPAFVLHLISFSMLLVGLVFGLCGGLPPAKILIALLVILLTSAVFHALGAMLAVLTVAFRGFFAVALLLGIGFVLSVVPLSMVRDKATSVLSFMSPWGAMDTLFWQTNSRYRWSFGEPLFMGSESLVLPVVVVTLSLFFVLLIWAATRKFDRPDRPALPPIGWIVLSGYWTLVCLGMYPNFENHQALQWSPNYGWQLVSALFLLGMLVVCVLALLDHPHERENVLTEECEFAAGREDAPGASARRLGHALFISLLVLASTALLSWMLINAQQKRTYRPFTSDSAVAVVGVATTLAFLFAIVLESAFVRFSAFWVRWGASFVGFAIFLAAIFIPLGAANSAYYRWERTVQSAIESHRFQQTNVQVQRRRNMPDLSWILANPDYAIYVPGTETLEDAERIHDQYKNNLPAFFWHYHPGASIAYPGVFLALVALLLLGRRRTYAALRREAQQAVKASRAETTAAALPAAAAPPASA
ncbi:MAG TPA: hypothetical protein VEJ63_16295 [Planctomycetota bacterium]|nr:hypothetical protein [Planctomycetota bacterium]